MRKGILIKLRDCEIELANSIKDKNFFKYFRKNKKYKSRIGPLHKEKGNITTDIEIVEILNYHFSCFYIRES